MVARRARADVREFVQGHVRAFRGKGDSFVADKRRLWSSPSIRELFGSFAYDLHPDGKRIAAAVDRAVVQDHVVFVSNFFDYLRKIAPVRK